MEPRQILLVDDHVIVRNGLKELIEKLGDYKVVREYDDGRALLNSFPFKTDPDLIVLDLNMPDMNGEQVMEEMNARKIGIPVLILTLNDEQTTIIKLFRLGARGYLQKNCSALVLKQALEEIFRCGYYHNEFLTLSLRHQNQQIKKTEQEIVLEKLTAREKEFLKLVCHEKEYTYEQIADQMKVQHRTVDGYREALFEKFGIKSKTGLVLFILKHNLFSSL